MDIVNADKQGTPIFQLDWGHTNFINYSPYK